MNTLRTWWLPLAIAAFVLLIVAAFAGSRFGRTGGARGEGAAGGDFAAQVDLAPLGAVAVHTEGRLKSFDSFAHGMMSLVSGSRKIAGRPPAFTYLDMLFRPEAYVDADVVYVKNKPVRAQIAEALLSEGDRPTSGAPRRAPEDLVALRERLSAFVETGLISPTLLRDPALAPLIDRLQADLIRTEKVVGAMSTAMAVMRPEQLGARLRIVPPPPDARTPELAPASTAAADDPDGLDAAQRALARAQDGRWHGIEELMPARAPDGSVHMGAIEGLAPDAARALAAAWADLAQGWRVGDVAVVNAALASLAENVAAVNPAAYPSRDRLALESWYFAVDNMSWVWLVYMLGVLPLLMWAVYRWPMALRIGMALFCVGLLLQTTAVGVRWYVADRWPNSNMFEAVTTASWFGAVAALLLELIVRRSIMRGTFALAASFASMTALMAAHFLPAYLNPNIGNMMPVLHDVWLYIHTNVIIFSYCLIFMAAVSAGLYLVWRLFGGGPAYAKVGGAGSLILADRGAHDGGARPAPGAAIASAPLAWSASRTEGIGATLLGAGRSPALAGAGGGIVDAGDFQVQAAAAISRDATPTEAAIRRPAGEIFDGVTMILMELSFILLWTGLVMGAIWADHSWGRPWGWDPKEVFALNTFLVFAILVHVRLKVKDKGLWTAILAIAGAGVMLFNWIVINFVIAGLHSYA